MVDVMMADYTYTQEAKERMYRAGQYVMRPPDVTTGRWNEAAWIKWVDGCKGWRPTGKIVSNLRLSSPRWKTNDNAPRFAWLDTATSQYQVLLGLTHATVGDAKKAALDAGYYIVDGEAGVFAQKREGP